MTATTRAAATPTLAPARAIAWPRSLLLMVGHGLREQRLAPLTWGGGLGAMSALMAGIWPSIESSMQELTRTYPAGLKEAFGIRELDSVEKYIDAEMLSLIVPLALVFFAVRCATRTTVGAEDRGHLDTLLSLPLSRRVLVASSLVVTAVMVVAILVVIWIPTWLVGTVAGTGISASLLAAGLLNVWPLAMAFAGLAVFCSGWLHRPAAVTAIAVGTLVAMYVIDLVGKLADAVEPIRVVSAFRYYGSAIQDGLDITHMLVLIAAAIVLAAIGGWRFERRDIL